MRRLLFAAALAAGIAACEPEYHETAETAAEGTEQPEVVGGADPTAISGSEPGDSGTIHHPAADGNSGRPPDGRPR
jgi:hypothetical protein